MSARPLCRYCGKPIAKRFSHTSLRLSTLPPAGGFITVDAYPKTLEEAARYVNLPVVSVRRMGYGAEPDAIVNIKCWDGESYESQYFCTGQCAQGFAVMILRTPTYAGLGSKAWADAVERQRAKAAAG